MKWLVTLFVTLGSVCCVAQTTYVNLDDGPITFPNNFDTNLRTWAWIPASKAGCPDILPRDPSCDTTGNMSHTNVHNRDGQSLQMNLVNSGNCSIKCYGDSQMFYRINMDNTASNATYLTLDMYATMDTGGNNYSQNLEYGIEQDIATAGMPGYWDRYVYGMECNYKSTGYWMAWWGDFVDAKGNLGNWVKVTDAKDGLHNTVQKVYFRKFRSLHLSLSEGQ